MRNVFNYDAQENLLLNSAYWYNPFGKQDSVVVYGAGGHRFTYNDKELDAELGFDMYYYGARFYDPSIGRFSSPDPVKDYHNPYSYVRNNPIRYIDPTGMSAGGWRAPELSWGGFQGPPLTYTADDPMDGDVGTKEFPDNPIGGNPSRKDLDKQLRTAVRHDAINEEMRQTILDLYDSGNLEFGRPVNPKTGTEVNGTFRGEFSSSGDLVSYKIVVNTRLFRDPPALIATLVKETTHYILTANPGGRGDALAKSYGIDDEMSGLSDRQRFYQTAPIGYAEKYFTIQRYFNGRSAARNAAGRSSIYSERNQIGGGFLQMTRPEILRSIMHLYNFTDEPLLR